MSRLVTNSPQVGGEFISTRLARNFHLAATEFILISPARKLPAGIQGGGRYASRPPGSAGACAPPINRFIPFWVHLNIGGRHTHRRTPPKRKDLPAGGRRLCAP